MSRFSAFLALACIGTPTAAFMVPKLSAIPTALKGIPDGWVGGFADSQPQYSYPRSSPDLSDLPMTGNLDNIDKLDRMQKVRWPEFSWCTNPNDETTRIYQQFAPDISRIGYTDDGRVYSIICPQQGGSTNYLGNWNLEVTVTGVRGWVDEDEKTVYADMSVQVALWFGKDARENPLLGALMDVADHNNFPFSKGNAIVIKASRKGEPLNPIFELNQGSTSEYPIPEEHQHWDEAYGVCNLLAQIGEIVKTGDEKVDELNEMLIAIANLGGGNMLLKDNVLSWNIWLEEPDIVDTDEWKEHAKVWRDSIDIDHCFPTAKGYTNVHDSQKYYDGTLFKPTIKSVAHHEAKLIHNYILKWKKKELDSVKEGVLGMIRNVFMHGGTD